MAQTTCSVLDCHKAMVARGWCSTHYQRWKRHGDAESPVRGPMAPFVAANPTPLETPCRAWRGGHGRLGYGTRGVKGKRTFIHRWVWEQFNGPIPEGMFVLHRCDNPPCFRLDHLFLGTKKDNARDMAAKGRSWQQVKTHCPHGHEYTPGNTYLSAEGTGHRHCRTCVQARRARKRLASPS